MSTKTTDACVDQTTHELSLGKFCEDKNHKEKILKEIIVDICAMLNTNGGKVVINVDADSNDISVSQMVRIVEQRLEPIIGTKITSHIDFTEDKETVTIFIKKADSLVIVHYHLYLPSRTQVIPVPRSEPQEKVKNDIVNRNAVHEPVQLGSHKKTFFKGKECGFSETKTVQLKNLEAGTSKRTTLADRMIGKGNKLSHYVSAFANYKGGNIYYGIDDNGIVAGEFISNEVKKTEIIKKVEQSLKKIIWPFKSEHLKRKVHWEIFFERVLDDNSAPIPSTFVIVIYISPRLGGVFTEEPECYEMVKGKVEKMSFTTWKKRILHPIESLPRPVIQLTVKRATWGSPRIQRTCSAADELLLPIINNGKSIELETISNALVKKDPDVITELQLIILAKKVMVSYRTYCFRKARNLLDEYGKVYNTFLRTANEFRMFYALRVYLELAVCYAQGNVEAVNNILPEAIGQAEVITPGRISAALYLLVAWNLLQQKGDNDNSPAIFLTRALEDLQHDQDAPTILADMKKKAHILLAMFYLGCDRFGVPTKKGIDNKCLKEADSSIMAVDQWTKEGTAMNAYREAQFNVVQSILLYRRSEVQPESKEFFQMAFETLKKAEARATTCNFQDTKTWCKNCMALFTEDLVRTHFQAPSS